MLYITLHNMTLSICFFIFCPGVQWCLVWLIPHMYVWLYIYARKGGAIGGKDLITVENTSLVSTHGSKKVQCHVQAVYN